MSGEKCSKITVRERSVLFSALQALDQARRDRQRERARQRDEAQRERERQRIAAQRERERQALASAKAQLKGLRDELAALNARAADYAKNFNGIEHSTSPPQLPSVAEADAGAILAFVAEHEAAVAGYRSKLNEAMLKFRRKQAIGKGRDEVAEWYRTYASATARTASTVIGSANNERLFGRQGQDEALRRLVFERARKLMAEVDGQVAHISDELRQKLESVLSAQSRNEALVAEAHLKAAVATELERVAAEKVRRQKEQQARQKEQQRLQTDRVAALMAQSLEEMGYVVSGVDESAYTQNGQIIACNPEQPDYAVRLTMDRANEQVRSNVVRLVDPKTDSSTRTAEQQKQDQKRDQEQDQEADVSWCKYEGIGRFREKLIDKGVDVGFRSTQPQDQQQIAYVSKDDVCEASPFLDDHFNRTKRRKDEEKELRQRSLDERST